MQWLLAWLDRRIAAGSIKQIKINESRRLHEELRAESKQLARSRQSAEGSR